MWYTLKFPTRTLALLFLYTSAAERKNFFWSLQKLPSCLFSCVHANICSVVLKKAASQTFSRELYIRRLQLLECIIVGKTKCLNPYFSIQRMFFLTKWSELVKAISCECTDVFFFQFGRKKHPWPTITRENTKLTLTPKIQCFAVIFFYWLRWMHSQ